MKEKCKTIFVQMKYFEYYFTIFANRYLKFVSRIFGDCVLFLISLRRIVVYNVYATVVYVTIKIAFVDISCLKCCTVAFNISYELL